MDEHGNYETYLRQYAQRSDDGLEELANTYEDLTPMAQQALRDELARRGLELDLTVPPANVVGRGPLVTIRKFRDLRL